MVLSPPPNLFSITICFQMAEQMCSDGARVMSEATVECLVSRVCVCVCDLYIKLVLLVISQRFFPQLFLSFGFFPWGMLGMHPHKYSLYGPQLCFCMTVLCGHASLFPFGVACWTSWFVCSVFLVVKVNDTCATTGSTSSDVTVGWGCMQVCIFWEQLVYVGQCEMILSVCHSAIVNVVSTGVVIYIP